MTLGSITHVLRFIKNTVHSMKTGICTIFNYNYQGTSNRNNVDKETNLINLNWPLNKFKTIYLYGIFITSLYRFEATSSERYICVLLVFKHFFIIK